MKFDYSKLIGRIVEKFSTQAAFAAKMGMSEHTLSQKLNSKRFWKQPEIVKAVELLDIPISEVDLYFFTYRVQRA